MIGRGAQGNPWIFRRITKYLETGEILPPPDAGERMEVALRHLKMLVDFKGEYIGVREMRRHLSDYTKGMAGAAQMRGKINSASTLAEMEEYIKSIFSL